MYKQKYRNLYLIRSGPWRITLIASFVIYMNFNTLQPYLRCWLQTQCARNQYHGWILLFPFKCVSEAPYH